MCFYCYFWILLILNIIYFLSSMEDEKLPLLTHPHAHIQSIGSFLCLHLPNLTIAQF